MVTLQTLRYHSPPLSSPLFVLHITQNRQNRRPKMGTSLQLHLKGIRYGAPMLVIAITRPSTGLITRFCFVATIPLGCTHQPDLPDGTDGSTTCKDEMATHRAVAITNLLFTCHVAGILLLTLVSFAVAMATCKSKVRQHWDCEESQSRK